MKCVSYLTVAMVFLAGTSEALADGGAVRLSEKQGRIRVTVFATPTPVAGPVEVSILVQAADTGEPHPDARVEVRASRRDLRGPMVTQTARPETSTNKLMNAAVLDLSAPGLWELQLSVESHGERAEVGFEMDVGEPLPGWLSLAGWIAWPAVVVAVYATHRRRVVVRGRGIHH